jgi:PadR family transcriptional regulator PadR
MTRMSNDVLQVGQSALYPALHKLERQGWIKSEWDTSETGRRVRYYSLTRGGRKALAEEAANWERLSAAISEIVRAV